jgi:hypothetical protein
MRKLAVSVGAVALLLGTSGPAAAQESARAVIERAIAAHGGRERLARVRADRVKIRGTLMAKTEVPFVSEMTVQLPGRFKSVIELTSDGEKHIVVQIINGDKAGVWIDGQTQTKIPPAALAEMRDRLHLDRAVRLVPLLTDKTFDLAYLGESKVNERTAVGVKVTSKGQKEVRLYFDKAAGLLAKTEHILDDGRGKEVRQEEYYGEYQDFGGIKRPTKVVALRDGKKLMEGQVIDVKYLDKVDEAEFTKP